MPRSLTDVFPSHDYPKFYNQLVLVAVTKPLHKSDESFGETYLLQCPALKKNSMGAAIKKLEYIVLKLPSKEQRKDYHRIKQHFLEESNSLRRLANKFPFKNGQSVNENSQTDDVFGRVAKVICVGQLRWYSGKIIDKCLRFDPRDRFSCADEMIDFILNAANQEDGKNLIEGISDKLQIEKHAGAFADAITGQKSGSNRLYDQFVRFARRGALNHGLSVRNGHSEFYGSRDEILNHVCDFLALCSKGDRYCTVTVPAYWTANNLGFNGRFLVKNKDAAHVGVIIQRVFLVASEFDRLPLDEQLVLLHQLRAQSDVVLRNGDRDVFNVRVAIVEKHELRDLERSRNLVAYVDWNSGAKSNEETKDKNTNEPPEPIGMSFMSLGTPRSEYGDEFWRLNISKVRFQLLHRNEKSSAANIDTLFAPHEDRFRKRWTDSMPLEHFVRSSSPTIQSVLDSAMTCSRVFRQSKRSSLRTLLSQAQRENVNKKHHDES